MKEGGSNDEEYELSLPERPIWLPRSHILAIVLGLAAIGGLAFFEIHSNYQTTLESWKSELLSSARHQSWVLQYSLEQSQDDTQVLADFAATRQLLSSPYRDPSLQNQVTSLFQEYRSIYEYGALYLFDGNANSAVQVTDSSPWGVVTASAQFKQVFSSVLRNRQYAVELGRGPNDEATLLFMMPVFADAVSNRSVKMLSAPLGVVVILEPFTRDLFPLLTANGVVAKSGETVLLQSKGSEASYVSPRKYKVPLNHKPPASDTLRTAAASSGEDHPTFGQFVDYRGVPVLAAIETIPSIHSVVVCKVDTSDALRDFNQLFRTEAIAAFSVLLAYVGLILMHNRRAATRQMREGLARQQHLNHLLETTVSQRTSQLAQINLQLHHELGERLRAEEEVRRFNVELDQRVHDRTAELEAANQELEAFSYSVSHDLRAPLRAVNVFSGIILEDFSPQLPEEGKKYLDWIRKGGEQMGCLIDDLLAFSRLSRSSMNRRRIDTGKLVSEVLEELSPESEGREIVFRVGNLPPCYGDPALLKQVWVNLLSNAIKYSRERHPALVEIDCSRETGENVYMVRDNGTGFDMAYAHKLFGVFQRLHRNEDFEGTGVGLAIVQRVINRHGGRVWAEAEEGRGATFRFTLAEELTDEFSGDKVELHRRV